MLPAIFCAFLNKWLRVILLPSSLLCLSRSSSAGNITTATEGLFYSCNRECKNIWSLCLLLRVRGHSSSRFLPLSALTFLQTCHQWPLVFRKKNLRCPLELWNFSDVPCPRVKNSYTHFCLAMVLLQFHDKDLFLCLTLWLTEPVLMFSAVHQF